MYHYGKSFSSRHVHIYISAILPAVLPAATGGSTGSAAALGSAVAPIEIPSSDTESVRAIVVARRRRHPVSIMAGAVGGGQRYEVFAPLEPPGVDG
jgi:hypothetical protein